MTLTRENCTRKQAEKFASRTSAWRLFSGKIDEIKVNYHRKKIAPDYENIKIPYNQLHRYAAGVLLNYLQPSHPLFDDVVGESVLRFLQQSGTNKATGGVLGSITYFTYLDLRKKKWFIEMTNKDRMYFMQGYRHEISRYLLRKEVSLWEA